jgi:hypothetical protein
MVVPQEDVQLLNPVTVAPDSCAAVQVKVLPVTVEFNATLLAVLPQMVCGEAEPTGVGLTVTFTVKGEPAQPPLLGVTVY